MLHLDFVYLKKYNNTPDNIKLSIPNHAECFIRLFDSTCFKMVSIKNLNLKHLKNHGLEKIYLSIFNI